MRSECFSSFVRLLLMLLSCALRALLSSFISPSGGPAVFEIIVILSLTQQTNFQLRQFNSHNNIIVFKEDGAILIEGKFDQS